MSVSPLYYMELVNILMDNSTVLGPVLVTVDTHGRGVVAEAQSGGLGDATERNPEQRDRAKQELTTFYRSSVR